MTAALLEAHGVRAGASSRRISSTFAERIRIATRDVEPDAFGAAVERAAGRPPRSTAGSSRATA